MSQQMHNSSSINADLDTVAAAYLLASKMLLEQGAIPLPLLVTA